MPNPRRALAIVIALWLFHALLLAFVAAFELGVVVGMLAAG